MASVHVLSLDHVALDVTDMSAAMAFYVGLLGLKEVPRPVSFDFPGAWLATGSIALHLVQRAQRDALGRRHICFMVANLSDATNALREAGFPIINDGHGTIPGIERFYTADPDGNRIEIQASTSDGRNLMRP